MVVADPTKATMNLTSQLRHLLTGLAAIGTLLLSWSIIAPDDVAAINKAGGDLVEPLVIFLSLVAGAVTRWAIGLVMARFSGNKEEKETISDAAASGGSLPLALLLGTAAGIMGCLPSCSGNYPLTGSVSYRDATTGAKGGLVFAPGKSPGGTIRLPIRDPQTGVVIGEVDLTSGK
jgi:hypothetical protein